MISFFRSRAISPETKLYTTLRFYATGSFLTAVGDFSGISFQSASRIIKQVSETIAGLKDEFIFMPRDHDELIKNYQNFYEISCFPTVTGTIDCTHVKILGQGGADGEVFRNRKQFFSINVQSVSSANLMFQDIVARWPGSTHDSHIFNESRLKQRFETGEFQHGVLLGDGGYKLFPYLMTPFRNPTTPNEHNYNRVQILVRNTVERKYGVWKRRFPCLAIGLRTKLQTSLTVIIACAVLHNYCIQQKDDLPLDDPAIEAAITATTAVANAMSHQIELATVNINRQAVQKRQKFVDQIAELNN